jgi:hypothetical protein
MSLAGDPMKVLLKFRSGGRIGLFMLFAAVLAAPATAQVVHAVSFGGGLFIPRAQDSRATGDVLVADLNQPVIPGFEPNTGSLAFNIKDFRSYPVFGEWHIAFNNHVEIGVGAAYMNQSVPSVYRDLLNGHGTDTTADDTEIAQTLRLQTIPISGVVRFLSGSPGHFQAYGGGGIVISWFKYSESGDFVDVTDPGLPVFNATFKANDVAFGPVILGGVRCPLGGDIYALNFEARYQWIVGNTGGANNGFLGDKIDLGGLHLTASFMIRF